MPRIRGLEESEAPWLARPLYWVVRRMFGKDLTPVKVVARRPGILWMGNLLGVAIERSKLLGPRLHVLAQLRAAQCVGCPF